MATAPEAEKKNAPRFAEGDRVALETPGGDRLRTGEVTALVGHGKTLHGYRIRWDDGHEALFSPSGRGLVAIE
jgi:hypothetical protein